GEEYVAGSTHPITWTASDPAGVASVDLALSTDGGVTFPTVFATGISNSGSYSWVVPVVSTTTARVRVTGHDGLGNTASGMSPADFQILAGNSPPTISAVPDSATIPE